MMIRTSLCACTLLSVWLSCIQVSVAEQPPITENVPMSEFQNRSEEVPTYDFDAPPQGMFRSIVMAEGFEEQMGRHQSHEIVPIKPTDEFVAATKAIYVVFSLHQHYQAFAVFGQCRPEGIPGLDPAIIVAEDAMHIALEDESGYLKLSSPPSGWKPGRYKVEIHAGEQVNEMSLMGTMRFTVLAAKK
ncbi:MAG: hypothetical protein KF890_14825 [Nitrospira sp.]|nr:hypothetical protein [Nitrospira sp.]